MRARSGLVAVHGLLVAAALGYFLVSLAVGSDDANIGAGLGLLALGALGLPWTLLLWVTEATGPVVAVVIVAAALLNLGLHAWWVRRRGRRRGQPVLNR